MTGVRCCPLDFAGYHLACPTHQNSFLHTRITMKETASENCEMIKLMLMRNISFVSVFEKQIWKKRIIRDFLKLKKITVRRIRKLFQKSVKKMMWISQLHFQQRNCRTFSWISYGFPGCSRRLYPFNV